MSSNIKLCNSNSLRRPWTRDIVDVIFLHLYLYYIDKSNFYSIHAHDSWMFNEWHDTEHFWREKSLPRTLHWYGESIWQILAWRTVIQNKTSPTGHILPSDTIIPIKQDLLGQNWQVKTVTFFLIKSGVPQGRFLGPFL